MKPVTDDQAGNRNESCYKVCNQNPAFIMLAQSAGQLPMGKIKELYLFFRYYSLMNYLHFFFITYFDSGSVVLQVVFYHHSIETQEVNIYVCNCIHSFRQSTSKSCSHWYRQMPLSTYRSLSDYTVSISSQTFHKSSPLNVHAYQLHVINVSSYLQKLPFYWQRHILNRHAKYELRWKLYKFKAVWCDGCSCR